MKYLYLILLIGFASCSKPKVEDPNAISLSMNAEVVENKWWAVSLVSEIPITSTGTVSVTWDCYNSNDVFLYKRSATVTYEFVNSRHSTQVKSTEQGAISMTAKNEKIVSVGGSGGYVFSY